MGCFHKINFQGQCPKAPLRYKKYLSIHFPCFYSKLSTILKKNGVVPTFPKKNNSAFFFFFLHIGLCFRGGIAPRRAIQVKKVVGSKCVCFFTGISFIKHLSTNRPSIHFSIHQFSGKKNSIAKHLVVDQANEAMTQIRCTDHFNFQKKKLENLVRCKRRDCSRSAMKIPKKKKV